MQERREKEMGQEVEGRCEGREGRKMKRRLGMWKEYERKTAG